MNQIIIYEFVHFYRQNFVLFSEKSKKNIDLLISVNDKDIKKYIECINVFIIIFMQFFLFIAISIAK